MIRVEVDSNLEDGMKTAARLKGELPEGADDAAKIIANSWRREGGRVMQKHGNVVTGTGINSMRTLSLGKGKEAVTGPSYLQDLETGTGPHYPDTNNYRFIAAARSYGMNRQALAQHIAQQGTKAHPWMNETTYKVRRSAPRRLKIKMTESAQDSISII